MGSLSRLYDGTPENMKYTVSSSIIKKCAVKAKLGEPFAFEMRHFDALSVRGFPSNEMVLGRKDHTGPGPNAKTREWRPRRPTVGGGRAALQHKMSS